MVVSTALPHTASMKGEIRKLCSVASHRGFHVRLSVCPLANTHRHQQLANEQRTTIPGKKGNTATLARFTMRSVPNEIVQSVR